MIRMLILFQGFQKYEEEFDPHSMVLYCMPVLCLFLRECRSTQHQTALVLFLQQLLWILLKLYL